MGLISLLVLTGCNCWFAGFEVTGLTTTGAIQENQTISAQKLTLIAPDFYGNGCPPSSNTVTSVDFYNGSVKIGSGTKDINKFSFDWTITPGQDGVAVSGVSEIVITAVDQTGFRSPQALKFKVNIP
jgi:hypothetical protein